MTGWEERHKQRLRDGVHEKRKAFMQEAYDREHEAMGRYVPTDASAPKDYVEPQQSPPTPNRAAVVIVFIACAIAVLCVAVAMWRVF